MNNLNYRVRHVQDPTDVRVVNIVDVEPYFDPITMQDKNDETDPQPQTNSDLQDGDQTDPVDERDNEEEREEDSSSSSADSENATSGQSDNDTNVHRRPRRTIRKPARYRLNWLAPTVTDPLPCTTIPGWLWDSVM